MPSLRVSKIKNGTVIDHIPAGNGRKLLNLLDIEENGNSVVSLVMNVKSETLGRKDIVKIENKELAPWEVTAAAVVAPNASLNVIKDFDVVEKQTLELPETIEGILDCPNPECVTNADEPIASRLQVMDRDPVTLRCDYCETSFEHSELDLPEF